MRFYSTKPPPRQRVLVAGALRTPAVSQGLSLNKTSLLFTSLVLESILRIVRQELGKSKRLGVYFPLTAGGKAGSRDQLEASSEQFLLHPTQINAGLDLLSEARCALSERGFLGCRV